MCVITLRQSDIIQAQNSPAKAGGKHNIKKPTHLICVIKSKKVTKYDENLFSIHTEHKIVQLCSTAKVVKCVLKHLEKNSNVPFKTLKLDSFT